MESLIFAVNAVAPIILTVAIGYILKKLGYMNDGFARAANKLVFHFFLPSMLFLNIYKIEDIRTMDFSYILYVAVVLLLIFLCSIPVVILVAGKRERRGVLLQAAFRSNYALVGIPLAGSLYGEAGIMIASVLSAVVVPLINILAVISLSMFRTEGQKPDVKKILIDICKNPLIRSIALALVVLWIRSIFVKAGISFRLSDITPLYTVLGYLSNLATPLALLMLGAQFEFSAVRALRREIIFGTLMRTVIVPILGVGGAYVLFGDHFNGAHFAAFVAVFATPVSVSSLPMAQEMNSDAVLAGQLVVWTTLVSAFSVFMTGFLLRLVGVF